MLPTEMDSFGLLVTELFAVHGRVAQKAAINAWWLALKSRNFTDISRVVRKLIEESPELPTPARVIAIIREDRPPDHQRANSGPLIQPSKTTLLAARSHMDMFGEQSARLGFGDFAVNILLKNPCTGYTAVDPRTYGGALPESIQRDLDGRRRCVDGTKPSPNMAA